MNSTNADTQDAPNWVSWINLVTGILTIISPYLFTSVSDGAKWDLTITGIVIGAVAIITLSTKNMANNFWPVINIIAGIWLVISTSFVQGIEGLIWSNVALGVETIVVAIVSQSYQSVHNKLVAHH